MKHIIISDVHDNFGSLAALIDNIHSLNGIGKICLGDVVGGPMERSNPDIELNSNSVIDLLFANGFATVRGNHDLFHIKELPIHQVYKKYPADYFSEIDNEVSNIPVWPFINERTINLSMQGKYFLKDAPEFLIIEDTLFSHFLYPDLTGSIILNKKMLGTFFQMHFLFMDINNCDTSFIGHLHIETPIIISNKKSDNQWQLNANEIISLDQGVKHIILCPAISDAKNIFKYVSYDCKKRSVEFSTSLSKYGSRLEYEY